jgi:hypothetical protein
MNGLKTYGNMAVLVTFDERLCAFQAVTMSFSETNVEWHKFQLRDNMQKYSRKHLERQDRSIARHQTSFKQLTTSLEELSVGR